MRNDVGVLVLEGEWGGGGEVSMGVPDQFLQRLHAICLNNDRI